MSQACLEALGSICSAAAASEIMDGQDDMLSCVYGGVSRVAYLVCRPLNVQLMILPTASCCKLSRWMINSHAKGTLDCTQKKPVS